MERRGGGVTGNSIYFHICTTIIFIQKLELKQTLKSLQIFHRYTVTYNGIFRTTASTG